LGRLAGWLLVAVGGALGSLLRYALYKIHPEPLGFRPFATLAANISGSFAIGVLHVVSTSHAPGAEQSRFFWITGVLGGYTTYSAFALESGLRFADNRTFEAARYIVVTALGCIAAVRLGHAAVTWLRG
jgi:CrcB protein